jgi:hypothetical protein
VRLTEGQKIKNLDSEETAGVKPVETTVGRVIFNDILPGAGLFYNYALDKKSLTA